MLRNRPSNIRFELIKTLQGTENHQLCICFHFKIKKKRNSGVDKVLTYMKEGEADVERLHQERSAILKYLMDTLNQKYVTKKNIFSW